MHEVVTSVLPIVRREALYRAELETRFGEISKVTGEPRLLGQVVLNLVMNALQAIPAGDARANRVSIETRQAGDLVQLVVRDTGVGIPEALRPRIFDPFFTTKAAGTGTGLGLAVTRQLVVERHRGRIDLDCPAQGGTVVTVSLPAAR